MKHRLLFFLGGKDLEMLTIKGLLTEYGEAFEDRNLAWGASVTDYSAELDRGLSEGRHLVLIELSGAVEFAARFPGEVTVVDHHGVGSGAGGPTALEQVFSLLCLPLTAWTRDRMLIAANDRGHVRELRKVGATSEEICEIRRRDRECQGISPEEEVAGVLAIECAKLHDGGRLAVVHLPHSRGATVTDANIREANGPEYENLLVFCPDCVLYFGEGRMIERLRQRYPRSWYGGQLPEFGYWGTSEFMDESDIICHLSEGNYVNLASHSN